MNTESPASNSTERIVFDLLEDTVVVPEPVTAAPIINNDELIVMSEFIKNLDVTFEIVSPITDIDFTISSPVAETKTVQPKVIERQEQTTFSFDLPLFKAESVAEVEESKVIFELTNETRDIKVNEAIQFVPVTELNDNGIIKYSLEEYMEVEPDFVAKPVAKTPEVTIPAELNITMKQVDTSATANVDFDAISPMEMTIEESLRMKADERRKKIKRIQL